MNEDDELSMGTLFQEYLIDDGQTQMDTFLTLFRMGAENPENPHKQWCFEMVSAIEASDISKVAFLVENKP